MDNIDQQIENLEVKYFRMCFKFTIAVQFISVEWSNEEERGNGNTTNHI